MVHAGCVFVAGIHPSKTWMLASFESVRWNACVHRLDLGLYSHPKEFLGNGVRTHVKSMGKIPSTGKLLPREGSNPQRCIKQDSKPNTLPMSYSGPLSEVVNWDRGQIEIITTIIMSVFPDRLSMWNMLNCAEQGQMQKYITRAYNTFKTVGVQTIMLKHPTKQLKKKQNKKSIKPNSVSMYT